jgi:hypothetical protein
MMQEAQSEPWDFYKEVWVRELSYYHIAHDAEGT